MIKELKCDWCNNTNKQIKNGKEYSGDIIYCGECSHEYVKIGTSNDNNLLEEMFDDDIKGKEYCNNCSNEITKGVKETLKNKGFCSSRCKGEHYS